MLAQVQKKPKLDFSNFDPSNNLIDHMILYQTTVLRLPGEDYSFTLIVDYS